LYAAQLRQSLTKAGIESAVIEVPAGENSKSLRQVSRVLERLPAMKLDRKSFVVALGGGVVGDLAGFVAATYLRGIPFIQIPTSLLAMVDSSVGGKTGVNLPQGKNLVGAFHQPRLVLADIGTLATLPARELRAGFAEVIKTAAIRDAKFFAWLEQNYRKVLALDAQAVARVVRRCCEVKADVVSRDERESGLRAILNFGHTIGHAMEALADYRGLLHGEAVAIGMIAAAELSVRCAGLKVSEAGRIQQLIAGSGLPTRLGEGYGMPDLLAAMKLDKKASAGRLRFVLLDRLGHAVVSDAVTDREIREVVHVCR
jgi:3-dehydroquinate synthase